MKTLVLFVAFMMVFSSAAFGVDEIQQREFLVRGAPKAEAPRTATFSGQFNLAPGTPLAGGKVFVYNLSSGPVPFPTRYWRVPDFVESIDSNGRFTVDVPPGEYCLAALKRLGETQIGPPVEGDQFILETDERNAPKKRVIASGEKQNTGIIHSALQNFLPGPGLTAIEGTVHDLDGKPVEGISVFAFTTPTIAGKPLFVSNISGKDGTFILRVHEGGTYYLKTRNSYGGGPPRGGAVLDGGKAEPLQSVTLKTGEIVRGIMLNGKKFPGRGPTKQ